MNPFGFALRWLDRRIARAVAEQKAAHDQEVAARVAGDLLLENKITAQAMRRVG